MSAVSRAASAILVAALIAVACTSLAEHVAAARRADDAVVSAAEWPAEAAWVVVAGGVATGAPDERIAWDTARGAPHRHVFRPGEEGDRLHVLPYLPAAGLVLGRQAADALGLTLRRDARETTTLARDVRRLDAGTDAAVDVRVGAPDGSAAVAVRLVLDPEFDGPLLVSRAVADALALQRFEIPGEADVQVALGRPFFARRARVRIEIPELAVDAPVQAIVPR